MALAASRGPCRRPIIAGMPVPGHRSQRGFSLIEVLVA
ncbi:MAG: type IV pilus modification PilV family protein, partial [Thermoleophilaceae bacterium]